MSTSVPSNVAGIHPTITPVPQTPPPTDAPVPPGAGPERLASWISDLSALHDLTERLARTSTLSDAIHETLRAGAHLIGARRGLIALRPEGSGDPGAPDGDAAVGRPRPTAPDRLVGYGLAPGELGHLETVPDTAAPHTRLLDAATQDTPAGPTELTHQDIAADDTLDPRHRDVARRLGAAASHAVLLTAGPAAADSDPARSPDRRLRAAAVWLYDQPTEPDQRQRHLLARYLRHAAQQLAHHATLAAARAELATLREGLLPSRLPYLPGVTLAVRHRPLPAGGGDFYDALALPEQALGLAIGSTGGSGPATVAAMGRLRAGLRAYAVMEGEDPVAVLSDLELLLRLTEPARSATALFGYAEPAAGRLVLASAGHPPPLVIGEHRAEFADTTLSAPLGMLACWEAPSVEIDVARGETVLLYSAGLLRRTGEPMDRAFARLRTAARAAAPEVRADPEALLDHMLRTVPATDTDSRTGTGSGAEEVVLLAVRFH
ncbi:MULTISPECIES: PP2C family protein-serine/threonine phosphatase [unclassified Streptomyces]|uniref:PP2C family protein-serine/threonine phosphatase n=1 Tax=unclassified Streptomyces TaxID=2593676 RepID=UPI001903D852|nr:MULTISPECIES: PP2C family protein-serine/threonine phosphatase [unclassified Streptomyces]MCU4747937.1 serine/threonine-protein phosphatase [Streptomyces sp. G-5]QQN78546.1 serine/threonine-protein phosphatase [Streptomyces sp. XC 2026]